MLLLNIVIVAFFFFNKPKHVDHPHHKMGPPPMLNLSEIQAEQFQVLADEHKGEMKIIKEEQKVILDNHFKTLYDTNSKTKDLSKFLELEQRKINTTYHHFSDLKALLNEEQLKNYPDFIEKTLNIILGGKKRNHPPKR